jgi:L-galactono-1,4-lactone dehydrogenase
MLGMALLDKIISVDVEKKRVTVQAGARVQQVADALKPHGLTLQNYASIRDQQMGGFTQVGAHGTSASIPPVDDQVLSMRLVTPAMGTVTLSKDDEPELFNLAKVGLGSLGVVTRLEIQCVDRHQLVEETRVCSSSEVAKNHVKWLKENKHLKYLWLPHTDSVVVVKCNPIKPASSSSKAPATTASVFTEAQRVQPLKQLYLQRAGPSLDSASKNEISSVSSATELRDRLLALDPLDKDWVAKINKAEEEFWKMSCGSRVGYSDEILGFDCGGEQCVLEASFPVAESIENMPEGGRSKDLEYVRTLLREIERSKIPAPCPIEQRWTSGSSSALSPAVGPPSSIHCWVGAIMYLPQDSGEGHDQGVSSKRQQVLDAFKSYSEVIQDRVMPKFNATWHWAKLELPRSPATGQVDEARLDSIRKRLRAKFPLELFNAYRSMLDPKNILANTWVDAVIPRRS